MRPKVFRKIIENRNSENKLPVRFHVCLPNYSEKEKYWLQTYAGKHSLVLHNRVTRALARKKHPSLAQIPDEELTHFTKEKISMYQNQVTRVHVRKTRRSEGFTDERSAAILAAVYNPLSGKNRSLSTLTEDPPPPPQTVDYISTAKAQLFHHYDLITKDEELADIIYSYMDQHESEDIYLMIQEAADLMKQMGEPTAGDEGWAQLVEPDYQPEGSNEMMTMAREEVQTALGPAMTQIMIRTKNDPRLEDLKWTIEQGSSVEQVNNLDDSADEESTSGALTSLGIVDLVEVDDDWSAQLKNTNSQNSLQSAIKVTGDRKIEITFTNTALRYLGAYIRFYDAENTLKSDPTPMTVSDWAPDDGEDISSLADTLDAQYDDLRFMGWISPVDTIFAVPNYDLPGELTVNVTFPEGAVKAEIFGYGLGTGSNLFPKASIIGGVLTGLINFGVPAFMLALGVAAQSYKPLYDIMNDNKIVAAAIGAGAIYFGSDFAYNGAVNKEMDWNALSSLSQILFTQGLDKAFNWVEAQIIEGEIEDEIPFAGWIMVAINVATGLAQIAETIGAVATSPWGIQNSISTTITSTINVHPDPTHGAFPQGQDGSVTTLVTKITYKDDSATQTITQEVDSFEELYIAQFENLLGGEVKFEVDYYIDSWLAGKATTGYMANDEEHTSSVSMYLVEFAKPIESDTVFKHTAILSYQDDAYEWLKTGEVPTETLADANTSNTGNHISKWQGLTLNQREGMLGAAWKAAGTGLDSTTGEAGDIQLNVFQNVNIPGEAMEEVKFPDRGYMQDAQLIYDSFPPKFKMDNDGNWVVETDPETGEETPVAADDDNSLGNYYVDPSKAENSWNEDGGYHLRSVDLSSDDNFDTSSGQLSHGRFPYFPNSFALHPSGYVIAVNTENAKIMILDLNQNGAADDSLPLARTYAGRAMDIQGSKGREGLLFYPISVACSYDGTILILDHLQSETTSISRIQAFDLGGNPVSRFLDEEGELTPFLILPNDVTYLDLAVVGDNKLSYLFALYYEDAGKSSENYNIAVYKSGEDIEDQSYVLTIPNIPVANITVDMWHTLYTLNYAMVKDENGEVAGPVNDETGPGGRTVPSISEWVPSVPTD